MAWSNNYNENSEGEKSLAYDLRQTYYKLTSIYLANIVDCQESGDYYGWFTNLKRLKGWVSDVIKEDEYNKFITDITTLANKYSTTWKGQNKTNPQESQKIEEALNDMTEYFVKHMKDGGLFGKGYEYDEDEI